MPNQIGRIRFTKRDTWNKQCFHFACMNPGCLQWALRGAVSNYCWNIYDGDLGIYSAMCSCCGRITPGSISVNLFPAYDFLTPDDIIAGRTTPTEVNAVNPDPLGTFSLQYNMQNIQFIANQAREQVYSYRLTYNTSTQPGSIQPGRIIEVHDEVIAEVNQSGPEDTQI